MPSCLDGTNETRGGRRTGCRWRHGRHPPYEGRAGRFVPCAVTRPLVGIGGGMIGRIGLCGVRVGHGESGAVARFPVKLLGVRRLSVDEGQRLGAVRMGLAVSGGLVVGLCTGQTHSFGAPSTGMPDLGEDEFESLLCASDAVAPALLNFNSRLFARAREHHRAVLAGRAELLDRGFVVRTMLPLENWLEKLTGLDEDSFELCGTCAKVLLPIVSVLAGGTPLGPAPRELPHGPEDSLEAAIAARPTGLAARAYAMGALDWLLPVLGDLLAVLGNGGQGSSALAETIVRTAPESGLLDLLQTFPNSSGALAQYDSGGRLMFRAASAACPDRGGVYSHRSLPKLRTAVTRVAVRLRGLTF